MNLNQLYYFVTLAEYEHYTKAAKVLSISQPSLSHAISLLEEEIGAPLFEKKGRNVGLTKYGFVFLDYVKKSLSDLELGIKRTKSMISDIQGRIDVGYIVTQGTELIPDILKSFQCANHNMKIEFNFSNGHTKDIIRGIKNEIYDIGFCSMDPGESDVDFIPVAEEQLLLVTPKDHPFAKKESVTLEEINQYPQIMFNKQSGIRIILDDIFKKHKLKPNIFYTVGDDGVLAGLVAKGFGIGIVPDVTSVRHQDVKMIKISNLNYRRYIYLTIAKDKYHAPIVNKFVEYVKKNYQVK
ncbi:MAG: LysR family transcriptional regulator [Anaerostipes sp.]|nr:LysR family transcriptional regulator [Anaerostipes sp.]